MSNMGGNYNDYWHPVILKQMVDNATKGNGLETLLARMFGVRREGQDGTTRVVMYYWRSKYYLVSVEVEREAD